MDDHIIKLINRGILHANNISFDSIRRAASTDHDLWNTLGRGRKILESHYELDQYLYSYGPMTRDQWSHILSGLEFISEPIEIFDYGCGQGLATALLLDAFGSDFIKSVRRFVLIEPSEPALKRAKIITDCYLAERIESVAINKKLEELTTQDLSGTSDILCIHIFSNVLDIEGYDHFELLEKIFTRVGRHCILAVSHDRDFIGGSARFTELESEILKPEYQNWFTVQQSEIWTFDCRRGKRALAWIMDAEVISGPI